MNKKLLLAFVTLALKSFGQNYTSYFTGNSNDIDTYPSGGICLMGGAAEDDNAMKWFLQRANGGDILVLRTSGSNGYNSYLYSGLGIPVNSVETILFNNALASNESYIVQKIHQAEAIWFAGGNQWSYINYWRNTPVDSAINQAIEQRNIVIGGTSAGMAIQGRYYFSAQNGTVTSTEALSNPYNNSVTVDSSRFVNNFFLNNTITDSHFDNPDRKGRLMTFLARITTDFGVFAKGIACDEYTAVCIDTNGTARVFGEFPNYDDNAYFVQSNCELPVQMPENCTVGNPLTWDLGELAVKAYQIKGDSTGNNTFDLNTWQSGTGGIWYDWFVSNGNFTEEIGTAINCPLSTFESDETYNVQLYPNPTSDKLIIETVNLSLNFTKINLYNALGQKFEFKTTKISNAYHADLSSLKKGIYYMIHEETYTKHLVGKIIKE